MVPTWDELLDRNRATANRSISATIYSTFSAAKGWDVERVWFGPPDRWRIEDADGVQLVSGPQGTVRRSAGTMERSPSAPDARVPTRTTNSWNRSTHELLVLHRDWPRSSEPQVPPFPTGIDAPDGIDISVAFTSATRSPAYEPVGPVVPTVVRGRPGWTVPCVKTRTKPYRVPVSWTFDDETGVVIGCNVGSQSDTIEVADLVVTDEFDARVFEYDGDTVDAAEAARRREADAAEEEELRLRDGRGNTLDRYIGQQSPPLLIRTDFSNEALWEGALQVVNPPFDDGDWRPFTIIDNPLYDGWGVTEFLNAIATQPEYVVLVDSVTIAHDEHPVLFLSTDDPGTEWSDRGTQVRVAGASATMVSDNLLVGNLLLPEFAEQADADGIVR